MKKSLYSDTVNFEYVTVNETLKCPRCGSERFTKNGHTHNGKQNHKCKDCNRQFVEQPTKKYIDKKTRDYINKLLLERIPLAGIARVMEVSEKWLQNYIKALYSKTPRQVKVSNKDPGKITIQCDELWSYVGKKENKQWIWLALDLKTREIVGVHIGDRSKEAAKELWKSLPPVYRQCAVCYTDFWESYNGVFPKTRHRAVDKSSGKTSHIERFNNTLRQRVSRLVRKTLSFSKSLEHHIGAIWYFIHHYNESLHV